MSTTHLHLLLNHFPVTGTLIGSGLLLWGIIKKQLNIKAAASTVLAIMSILAIPVYLTGEPAEDAIENLPGVSEAMIELHENAAIIATWLMGITGLTSLMSLIFAWQKRKSANTFFIIAFVLSAVCFAAMARAAYYGGQILHSEIRYGNSQIQNEQEDKTNKKDDD